jgi:hypothetical protein
MTEDPSKMTPPSGGCENCGRPVRTWKRGLGWVCHKCAPALWREYGIPPEDRRYQPDHG